MKKRVFLFGALAGFLAAFSLFLLLAILLVGFNYAPLSRLTGVITLIETRSLERKPSQEMIDGAARGLVEALGDPYSVYLSPKEYEKMEHHLTGVYGGVGLLIGLDEKERLMVVKAFQGTPARRAGLQPGDRIVSIDGKNTVGMLLDDAASLMQGAPGTKVKIAVLRAGSSAPKEIELAREKIEVPTVEEKMLPGAPSVGYASLSMFNEKTGKELGEALQRLRGKGARGLILDLRSNPGGTLPAAVEVADYFVPEGPIVFIEGRAGSETYKAKGQPLGLPLAVLVNEGSASASEIVAGAIKDTGSGILVGEKTFGKGLVQTVFPLHSGAALKLTTARYLTPKRNDINKKGIQPDLEVPLSAEEEARLLTQQPDPQQDPQLKKALEQVRARL